MKKTTNHSLPIILFVVLIVSFFAYLNLIYTTKSVRDIYSNPNICVELSQPLFGISGIEGKENDQYRWERIDRALVVVRTRDRLWLFQNNQGYVSLDKTSIIDTFSDRERVLSKDELIILFTDLCAGKSELYNLEYEMEDLTSYYSQGTLFLYGDIKLFVKGRYEGYITIKTDHPVVSVDDTNFSQLWNDAKHFPYHVVVICLLFSLLFSSVWTIICYFLTYKKGRKVSFYIVMCVPVFFLLCITIYRTITYFSN